jgi:hypothetical protein
MTTPGMRSEKRTFRSLWLANSDCIGQLSYVVPSIGNFDDSGGMRRHTLSNLRATFHGSAAVSITYHAGVFYYRGNSLGLNHADAAAVADVWMDPRTHQGDGSGVRTGESSRLCRRERTTPGVRPFTATLTIHFPEQGKLVIMNAASPVSARKTRLFAPGLKRMGLGRFFTG